MEYGEFNAHRKSIETKAGEISYVEIGDGPPALFVHGVFMSSGLWRHVIGGVRQARRCIAFDLPVHGRTRVEAGHDLSLPAQAQVLEELIAALGLDGVDLVANDTGGAIAQVFATRNPERVRTLTLTNCDVHDQLPPDAFRETAEAAKRGDLASGIVELHKDFDLVRRWLGVGFEHPERLTDEAISEHFARFGELDGAREVERALASLEAADLIAIEPQLAELSVPTLIVWGTGDVFFDLILAYWLRDTIAGAERVVEVEGAKLFFPEERADELVPHLLAHWAAHAPAGVNA